MRRKCFAGILAASLLLSACSLADNKTPQVSRPEDIGEMVDGTAESDGTQAPDTGEMDGTAESDGAQAPDTGGTVAGTAEGDGTQAPDTAGEPDGGAEAQPPADGKMAEYGSIYREAVTEHMGEAVWFALIYLDDDDVPELAVCDRGQDSYSVYTVKDNALFCMADAMMTVELTYFERSGILCEFARWNGGGAEGGYGQYYFQVSADSTLTADSTPVLYDTYNAVYNEEGVYTGEGITNYYHEEQEIEKAAYEEMKRSMGIPTGGGRPCTENAVGGEEMLAVLSEF